MGVMARNGNSNLPSLGRVRLEDLVASEGLPSDSYKISVSTLAQSLQQYSAAIVQLSDSHAALLRCGLECTRLFFHQRGPAASQYIPCHHPEITVQSSESGQTREWCKTSGYHADPQLWQEAYDFRPGITPIDPSTESTELCPPAGLPDMFALLGKASRDILDAIGFSLNLRSFSFIEMLDNIPLRNREISSSVLSAYCHSRPSFQNAVEVSHHQQQHSMSAGHEDDQLVMFSVHEHQVDKSLITVIKPDKPGLHIKDIHGHWVLVDGDLGPQEIIVYPGLALYQATAGYVNPALHRTEGIDLQANIYGRCSLAFKLMPRSMASFSCSEMRAAGHGVEAQFQLPIPVDDFMQRSHSMDQILHRQAFPNYTCSSIQDGTLKPTIKRRKVDARSKPLPPSKRLRLEAQRVLKERVQEIADKKGLKLRFCSLKDCEGHMKIPESPCATARMEIGWPPGVPFVHPHDLPNKAKIGFLEAYEPGWTALQQDIERFCSTTVELSKATRLIWAMRDFRETCIRISEQKMVGWDLQLCSTLNYNQGRVEPDPSFMSPLVTEEVIGRSTWNPPCSCS